MTKTGDAARPPIASDPDSLLDTLQIYRRQIMIAAVVLAAGGGSFYLWQASKARRATQAEKALFDAMSQLSQSNPKATDELAKVAKRYSGTAGGTQAAMLLAQSNFDAGKYDEGRKVLDEIRSPGAFAPGVESLKAAGYEGQQKFDLAADHYMRAVERSRLQGEKDYLKGEAARSFATAGKRAEALKIWQELAGKADSPMQREAKIRVGELSASAAKP